MPYKAQNYKKKMIEARIKSRINFKWTLLDLGTAQTGVASVSYRKDEQRYIAFEKDPMGQRRPEETAENTRLLVRDNHKPNIL